MTQSRDEFPEDMDPIIRHLRGLEPDLRPDAHGDPGNFGFNGAAPFVAKSPIEAVVEAGNKESLLMLLEKKADVNEEFSSGLSSLQVAVAREKVDIVKILLEHKADVNEESPSGLPPLHVAVDQERVDIVKILLEHKADVSADPSLLKEIYSDEDTTILGPPLMHAVCKGSVEVMRSLLEAKADPLQENLWGKTAVHYLAKARKNQSELAQALKAHSAPVPSEPGKEGDSLQPSSPRLK